MRRKAKVELTDEQRKAIIEEYPTAIDSKELAERLGLTVKKLYTAAAMLDVKKTDAVKSAIATKFRRH